MQTLIDTITLSNTRVKKLNVLRSQCCLDPNERNPVSDDEAESLIPDLSSFMSIPVTTSRVPAIPNVPLAQFPLAHTPNPNLSGLDSIAIDDCPPILAMPAIANILPNNWQMLLAGNVDQTHRTNALSNKAIMVNY